MDSESGIHGSDGWKPRIPGFGPCYQGDFQVQEGHRRRWGRSKISPSSLGIGCSSKESLPCPPASSQFLLSSLASPPLYSHMSSEAQRSLTWDLTSSFWDRWTLSLLSAPNPFFKHTLFCRSPTQTANGSVCCSVDWETRTSSSAPSSCYPCTSLTPEDPPGASGNSSSPGP